MTSERFEVPADVVMDAPPYGRVVRAVDVPALVRSEVELALLDQLKFTDSQERFRYERASAYLASRFGPEEEEPHCLCDDDSGLTYAKACPLHGDKAHRVPTPSASAASTAQGERCPKCGRWFLPQALGQPTVSCCVLHPRGACCHHFQTEVPAPPSEAPANCTACACASCADQRAFVRELAKAFSTGDSRIGMTEHSETVYADPYPASNLARAARKVSP